MPLSAVDRRMIAQAHEVRKRSHDPHRQVGVVITVEGEVVSSGANEAPPSLGLNPEDSHRSIIADPDWKYYVLEHAERNAIFDAWMAGRSLGGATMYGTLFPCADCARAIAAASIGRLVVPRPGFTATRDQKWLQHYRYAEEILRLAGVTVDFFEPEGFL